MARNTIMALVGGLSVALLVAAAVGTFRVFSYLAALFVLATVASAAIERADGEFDIAPYTGLVAGLGVLFLSGLTGIWLTWSPGTTTFTYVFGLPTSTFFYVLFLWALPLLGAIYYSVVFDRVGGEAVVEAIMADAREAQSEGSFPLVPRRVETPPDRRERGEPTDD
ncbi:hypothetical protein [Halalkalicoccus jeotgali]|uniref:Uncharacterized protein n=1 Tax=Halalkalicoccus jeotgali (strain DSM 18796 / CECT 7217 / JCM 14584 / KCTC 4019 / B3) TaxID=795797 RepID=D8J4Q6_HALJB|nr:hypothetical protein [Halalkalicoccus jeotgali]ADJ15523.1 hypothetical protein HacjB3_10700 [Halalkalicoccus jeotgali B3]ELY36068.1 hypothetical protein C497_11967 [Halalkalicoccus jeotgali B3]